MTDLTERFAAAMARLPQAPEKGAMLVVAVSGGADSMALWDMLVRVRSWPLVVWHLNHGLRPDAELDLSTIRAHHQQLIASGFAAGTLVSEHTDVAALARQWHDSLEAAGRRHRYARLAAVAQAHGAVGVLTAHHRDDQAETVLANLLRGAGPMGRSGIPPRRILSGKIALFRPLLGISRSDLRAHCEHHGVPWREDSTNEDIGFQRNYLRHSVLPALEHGVPGMAEALVELAHRSQVETAMLEIVASDVWQRSLGAGDVLLQPILLLPADRRRQVWRKLLLHLGLTLDRAQLERIDQLARGLPGHRLHLGRWLLLRRARTLAWELAHPQRDEAQVEMIGPGIYPRGIEQMECRIISLPSNVKVDGSQAYLDASVCVWPLVWRPAHSGEQFIPLGAPGRQTVVKFLSTRGVSSRLRPGAPVVADANGVVWVPGFTIAERMKLTAKTREVVHVRWSSTCGIEAAPTFPTRQDHIDERS